MVGIFCGWGFCPAELPVINLQAKPDRFYFIIKKNTIEGGFENYGIWVVISIVNRDFFVRYGLK